MARRMHRDTAKRVLIGFVALCLGLVIAKVGVTVQGGGALPTRKYTVISAQFSDVGTLKAQQKVAQDGVRVGVITDVSFHDGAAHVTMRLDGDKAVYGDATARVGNESALGRKFIALDPGTPSAGLLGGREIPEKQTAGSIDLGNVLEAFPAPARAGLGTTLNNLGSGIAGHSDDLYDGVQVAPQLLDNAQTILRAANADETNLPALLQAADRVVGQLNGHEAALAALIDNAGQTFGALNADDTKALRSTIRQAPETLRAANQGLRAINPALSEAADAVKKLRPGVGDLVDATPDLRGFLTESPPVALTVVKFADEAVPGVKALVPAVSDLKPAITHLGQALGYTDPILAILGPFAPDAGHLFANHNLLSGNYGPTKHYFSAELVFPGLYNVSVPDPLAKPRPYEGPGGAFADSADAKTAAER